MILDEGSVVVVNGLGSENLIHVSSLLLLLLLLLTLIGVEELGGVMLLLLSLESLILMESHLWLSELSELIIVKHF